MSSLENVKLLREKTGAGMVDCKKALEEAGDDIEKAVELLRKKGIAKASKRTDRETREGVIKLALSEDGSEAYMVQISAETDFVARNEKFLNMAEAILTVAKTQKPKTVEELNSAKMENGTVEENLKNLSGTIGEKMEIADFAVISGPSVGAYSHLDGQIGALVALDKAGEAAMAGDIAMHIAAAAPRYLSSDEVPQEEIDKEKEIYREQLLKEGKPESILDKILEGKINKYFEEVCLLNQEYIKDDKKKVSDILGEAKIQKYFRFAK